MSSKKTSEAKAKEVERIKKLLNLALDPKTPKEEADNAYKKAKEIMNKSGITESEISRKEIKSEKMEIKISKSVIPPQFVQNLISEISRICRVSGHILILKNRETQKRRAVATITGYKTDVEIGKYLWETISGKLIVARKKFLEDLKKKFQEMSGFPPPRGFSRKMLRDLDDFCHGWVLGITANIPEERIQEEKRKIFEQQFEKEFQQKVEDKVIEGRKTKKTNMETAKLGFDIGKKEKINKGLN